MTTDSLWSSSFAHASVSGMQAYDATLARWFTPWAQDLVDRLAPPSGSTALDIAAGPGTVTHVLAERCGPTGRVVATDISAAMIEIGRAKPVPPQAAPIEWIEAPAAPIPLSDASVDVVTCQQGLQFFPDREATLAEVRRVLRSGGVAGFAVWTRIEDQIFSYLRDAIATVVSPEVAARYLGPFLLEGEQAASCARAAGFANVDLQQVTLPVVLPGGAEGLFSTLPAAAIAPDIAALDDSMRSALLDELVWRTGPLRDGDTLRGSLTASVLILS